MIKAETYETNWLLDVARMGCVKSSVQVTVKWIKYKSPDQEQVIKNGKGEIGCPLDEGNSIFYVKKGDSGEMENLEGSQHHTILS